MPRRNARNHLDPSTGPRQVVPARRVSAVVLRSCLVGLVAATLVLLSRTSLRDDASPGESFAKRAAAVLAMPAAPAFLHTQRLSHNHRTAIIVGLTGVVWTAIPLGVLGALAVRRRWLAGDRAQSQASARAPPQARSCDGPALSRRRVLTDGAALALATPAFATGVYTTAIAPSPVSLRVRRWRIDVTNLPAALSGLRLAHISDLHQGAMMPTATIARAVELALRERPDMVVLTGDYADRDGGDPRTAASLLAPLADTSRCRLGAVGVLGNHDWYVGGHEMRDALEAAGIRVIDHTRLLLTASRRLIAPSRHDIDRGSDVRDNPDCLVIAGLGDFWEDRADPRECLVALPDDVPRLLLMHNPDAIFRREFRGLLGDRHPDLILAGHTHGGQVRIPLGIGNPRMPPHYSSDAFSHEFSDTRCGRMLVSHGVGCTIMPVRFGVPPEIGVIELVRSPDA